MCIYERERRKTIRNRGKGRRRRKIEGRYV